MVFRVASGKWRAVVSEISRMYKTGRPVLIGTTSVEQSEALGKQLDEVEIPYQVLRTEWSVVDMLKFFCFLCGLYAIF